MISPRAFHTATTLGPSGANADKVLITGGEDQNGNILNTAELYDPATGTFACADGSKPAGVPPACPVATKMADHRQGHTATLLPNGLVLLTGGDNASGATASAELYDPSAGAFTATNGGPCPKQIVASTPAGCMLDALDSHTATLLPNGQVFIAGGFDNVQKTLMSDGVAVVLRSSQHFAQLFNPAAKTFKFAGFFQALRANHAATLLPSGKVLLTGGAPFVGGLLHSSEIYDAASQNSQLTGNMIDGRVGYSATQLPNGAIVVIGGTDSVSMPGTIEIYNPATGQFIASSANMIRARSHHTATLLTAGPNSGKILVIGGLDYQTGTTLGVTEFYDPVADTEKCIDGSPPSGFPPVCPASTNTIYSRVGHTATVLPNGNVLVSGGMSITVNVSNVPPATSADLSTAELYNAATNTFTCVDGSAPGGSPPVCPGTTNMIAPRMLHTATLLGNGRVLLAGGLGFDAGSGSGASLDNAELFDPKNGIFLCADGSLPTGSPPACPGTTMMISSRAEHSATLLTGGQVLLAGGMSGSARPGAGLFVATNSAELYYPTTGTFKCTDGTSPTGLPPSCPSATNLTTPRVAHATALLRDGKVIFAGGLYGEVGASPSDTVAYSPFAGVTLSSIEVFDPATGTFASGGSLLIPRAGGMLLRLSTAMTPTPTPTASRTSTPTRSPTRTPTRSPTRTPSPTATRTATRTLARTPTRTTTRRPTRTPTQAPTRTSSHTPSRTATRTARRTSTRTPARTATQTPGRTTSRTPSPAGTRTATRTATRTSTRSPLPTATP